MFDKVYSPHTMLQMKLLGLVSSLVFLYTLTSCLATLVLTSIHVYWVRLE
jgi:hypothetical protein